MKKIIASALVAVAAGMALGGCATGSTSITDEQKISSIRVGKSTTQDVERTLGKPGDVQLEESGAQVWTYQTVKSSVLAFIPVANLLGNSMQEDNLTVRFNKKGVVTALGRGQHKL
ncbi:outer membrane protein assembly factor BamE [Burkholderia sp. Ac-20353]|uniref:outer membrane protein assembly factor BamE domain-containing protein n=1 Tax=Burkholderia sp. Ac-20353 TaxID=2703894 RepID=UPI00197C7EEC|nr:outer membrane protein assembly factor BamE [Burkholderia sp. Ac-20353]MBN3792085.1 outer membrane protein assembly factor BamE [Burkholderia sp. Ac-20353]